MKRIFTHTTAVLAIACCSQFSHANTLDPQQHYNYVEFAYAYQSTDWRNFDDDEGYTFLASAAIHQYIHVHTRYNSAETFLPKGVRQDGWWTYGIGGHYYIAPSTSLLIGVDRHELESQSRAPNQQGWEYKVGIRHDFNDQWRATLEAGRHDLIVSSDATFIVEGLYQPVESVGISLRLRDYDKLDLTSYELGVRWSF